MQIDVDWWNRTDSLFAVSSYIRGMLSSHALMKGVGVGEEQASALGAIFVFLMRDIAGMVSGVVFASIQGQGFDAYPKQWRLFADFMNNVGLFIDLIAPRFGGNIFLALLCLGRIFFALVGKLDDNNDDYRIIG